MSEMMSASAYARHRGVAVKSVMHAINSGRIQDAVSAIGKGKARRYQINVSRADELWNEGLNLSKSRSRLGAGNQPPIDPGRPTDPDDVEELPSATESNARKLHWEAKMAKLKFEEKAGKLVDKENALRQVFAFARTLRDRILGVPGRIEAQVASENRPLECHRIMRDELIVALQALEKEVKVA